MCTHWRQTTANERAYGAHSINTLVATSKTGFSSCMTLNPQSTLNTVGLVARPQHSPCPCYTHVLSRCLHGGTTLVHQTLAGATVHRLIERWVEQTGRWLSLWYRLEQPHLSGPI